MTTERTQPTCLQEDHTCDGEIEYRMALSASGKSFPRCARHWGARLVEQDRIDRLYGGDVAPADFDPGYAGERW